MIRDLLSIYFILSGCIFFLTSGIAMIRFPDLYSRLHAGSKSLAGGTLSFLLAYLFQIRHPLIILKILLITMFLLITNSIATHALARTAYRQNHDLLHIHHDESREHTSESDHSVSQKKELKQ